VDLRAIAAEHPPDGREVPAVLGEHRAELDLARRSAARERVRRVLRTVR
jgi:hypothetical protein